MKILMVAGARPNFMKIAPIIRAIKKHNNIRKEGKDVINYLLVHTGQHYDKEMSEIFFEDLEMRHPDINLKVGSGSHAAQTAKIMVQFERVCLNEKPNWVIVVGDVNSTLACTIVAAKLGIRIGHVEAGLRSYDRTMPEEINRLVTDVLADLLFTPSLDADQNLFREGIPAIRIKRVGNIMIDTLITYLNKARERKAYEKYGLKDKKYCYVTVHRPSNVDDESMLPLIIEYLERLSMKLPVIFPVHPRTKKKMMSFGIWNRANKKRGGLILAKSFGYLDSLSIVDKATFVITDSGGIQEETTFLGIPCLTLRPNTERPITISLGTNKLTSIEGIEKDVDEILGGGRKHGTIPELWDGMAGERILKILSEI